MASPVELTKSVLPLFMGLMFLNNKSQMVKLLLSMELVVCLLFVSLGWKSHLIMASFSLSLIFMCVMVCEAMLGIGILILMVRNKGNNLIKI